MVVMHALALLFRRRSLFAIGWAILAPCKTCDVGAGWHRVLLLQSAIRSVVYAQLLGFERLDDRSEEV